MYQTLTCTSSAGNQLFTDMLRSTSILARSEPSGGFLGLLLGSICNESLFSKLPSLRSICNESFFLGSNMGVMDLGGVQLIWWRILLFRRGRMEWLLPAEFGLDSDWKSLILISGTVKLRLTFSLSAGCGVSEALSFSVRSAMVTADGMFDDGVSTLENSVSWVEELWTLSLSECLFLNIFTRKKKTMSAIMKQTRKVTATETTIAVVTWEPAVPNTGGTVCVKENEQKPSVYNDRNPTIAYYFLLICRHQLRLREPAFRWGLVPNHRMAVFRQAQPICVCRS